MNDLLRTRWHWAPHYPPGLAQCTAHLHYRPRLGECQWVKSVGRGETCHPTYTLALAPVLRKAIVWLPINKIYSPLWQWALIGNKWDNIAVTGQWLSSAQYHRALSCRYRVGSNCPGNIINCQIQCCSLDCSVLFTNKGNVTCRYRVVFCCFCAVLSGKTLQFGKQSKLIKFGFDLTALPLVNVNTVHISTINSLFSSLEDRQWSFIL